MSGTSIVLALISSGVVSSFITHLFDRRKKNSETFSIDIKNSEEINTFLQESLKDSVASYKAECEGLRQEIKDLNNRINNMMEWIVIDNNSYRNWLECELKKVNPDIQFPECRPAPGFESRG